MWGIRDDAGTAGKLPALSIGESMQAHEFGVIPLFVLMGLLVGISGVGRDTCDMANHLFRKVRGVLGTATAGANAAFAAVTGTTIASVFTRIAVPEMLRHGYRPRFSVGAVVGSSVLGMLILPPSLLLIAFGILSEQSIGDLFIAGVVPGLALAAAYCVLVWIMARRFPESVGTEEALNTVRPPLMTGQQAALKSVPIALVLGGIYGGLFTATEAGGVGALGALALTCCKRRLTGANLWEALSETGHVTASICFLLVSAHIYSRMIAMTGIPNIMEQHVEASGLGLAGLLAIYIVAIIPMGTILDAGSIVLIAVPLALPALAPFGIDLVRNRDDHRGRDRASDAAARPCMLRHSQQSRGRPGEGRGRFLGRGAVRGHDAGFCFSSSPFPEWRHSWSEGRRGPSGGRRLHRPREACPASPGSRLGGCAGGIPTGGTGTPQDFRTGAVGVGRGRKGKGGIENNVAGIEPKSRQEPSWEARRSAGTTGMPRVRRLRRRRLTAPRPFSRKLP